MNHGNLVHPKHKVDNRPMAEVLARFKPKVPVLAKKKH